MMRFIKFILIISFLTHPFFLFSQASQLGIDADADFKLAKEMYRKNQYSLAFPLFKQLAFENNAQSKLPVSVQLESKYYSILCGLHLDEETSESLAKEFIELEHHAPRIQMMSYELANFYFRRKNYIEANDYFEKAGINNLSNQQIADMKFKQAYGYFTMKRFSDAKPLFNSIRQITNNPNYLEANYYYGFILFNEKQYQQALESFLLVEKEPSYSQVVPYYLTEIFYFTGKKDKAIEYGEKILETGNQFYEVELNQLIGHAWFEKQQYAKALPYLDYYVSKSNKVRREDMYELSYCYFKTNQTAKAIQGFKQLGGKEDSLAQNSMYLLADLYLKSNQKANARNAFLFCASNSSNQVQKEISKFHYAKLSYELGFNNIALDELQLFLSTYPNSTYKKEVQELMVAVMANTNNFKDALQLYETLNSNSDQVKKAYPQILYGRAVEYINDQQLNLAEDLLDKIIKAPYNSFQLPYTYFWKGEIAFRNNNIDDAIRYYSAYLRNPATNGEVNVTNARYNLGYSYLRNENYSLALANFEQVSKNIHSQSSLLEQDAYLRAADCHFMQKRFQQASAMYDVVINNGLKTADYAYYQKAIIAGGTGRSSDKINTLQNLEKRYPNSVYLQDAYLEMANSYLADENYRAAIVPLQKLINDKNADAVKPLAYLKLGIAYFNLEENTKALEQFKKLVSTYPNANESDDAIVYIKNIYIENQKTSEYVNFMKQNGKQISYSEEDSLMFASALVTYNKSEFQNALNNFLDYSIQYKDGRYFIDANYYVAEIFILRKDHVNALKHYLIVAERAPNKFAERSVLQVARIYFFEHNDYEKAKLYFVKLKNIASQPENKLESMRGLLRCQYKLNEYSEGVDNANELLENKSVATDDKMMANLMIAKSYLINNQKDKAIQYFKAVYALGKSEFAAEARYQVSKLLFEEGKLQEAEKNAFDVINKSGSYDYWITSSYILLGDIFWKQKDYFNAEATFKSVAENAHFEDLKKTAKEKLDKVIEDKNKSSKVN
jgi:tetratricopeptide (TPR) repeat protein